MNEARLKEILDGFPKVKIAVIGDFFLDKWLMIDRTLDEPSLETGLIAYQVTGKRLCPGAAGTVTNNLAAMDIGEIYAIGFTGDDGEGYELIQGLKATGVRTNYLVQTSGVFTPTYIKPLFDVKPHPKETHRLDIRNRQPIPWHIERMVIDSLYEASRKVDAIIALDQVTEENTGVLTARVRDALAYIGQSSQNLIVYADSRAHLADYKNVIVKCNHLEAVRAILPDYEGEIGEETIRHCALAMAEKFGKQVFVTWGQNGMFAVKEKETVLVPAIPVEGPLDICGAGDSANAAIVASLCMGAAAEEAAMIANLAASITIQQIGTTGTASRDAIAKRFRAHNVV